LLRQVSAGERGPNLLAQLEPSLQERKSLAVMLALLPACKIMEQVGWFDRQESEWAMGIGIKIGRLGLDLPHASYLLEGIG